MTIKHDLKGVPIDAIVVPRAGIDAETVAQLLGLSTANAFLCKRRKLETLGFPSKLPGLNCWSYPAVMRWVETNGESFAPAPEKPARPNALAGRYA